VTGANVAVDSNAERVATGSLEDEQPVIYVVAHWTGTPNAIAQLRVRLVSSLGATVPIAWLGEISLY
jgi:hypothetical protein